MALSRRQLASLPFVASTASLEAVSRQIKISSNTLRKWLADPDYQAALNDLIHTQVGAAALEGIGIMSAAYPRALDKLVEVFASDTTTPECAARAAASFCKFFSEERDRLEKLGRLQRDAPEEPDNRGSDE